MMKLLVIQLSPPSSHSGRRPLGRPRCRQVDNIQMNLGEIGCGGVHWIGLALDREIWRALVNEWMKFRVS
jgi:hypothetical protein